MEIIVKNAAGFLRSLFDAAVAAADPINSLPPYLINLQTSPPKGRTIILGAGKAGGSMAKALEEFWDEHFPEKPIEGLVITRYGHGVDCKNIDIIEASHPVPDEAGLRGAERLLSLTHGLTRDDLVICLISGGASALLSLPARGISASEKQDLSTQLLRSGATIHEINAVRKHLSAIKGGRLAKAIAPAKTLTFCISDVPGDELDVIGSGPTVGDPTFFADALQVLKKYNIPASANILNHLHTSGDETPKPDNVIFKNCQNILVATPQMALEAASKVAISAGITPLIIGDAIEGVTHSICTLEFQDNRRIYDWILENLDEFNKSDRPHQYEFSRLNLEYATTSKRKLKLLVENKYVTGWNDPRMPTISGLKRRGYTPASIRDFSERIGVSKVDSLTDISILESSIRDDLNIIALRTMAVIDPIKIIIENYSEGKIESLKAPNHPQNEAMGYRKIFFSPWVSSNS